MAWDKTEDFVNDKYGAPRGARDELGRSHRFQWMPDSCFNRSGMCWEDDRYARILDLTHG